MAQPVAGAVRCVYLDPPYNNSETYTHYTNRLSHGDWWNAEQRLKPYFDLLRDDGGLWISIDDTGMHYLKG